MNREVALSSETEILREAIDKSFAKLVADNPSLGGVEWIEDAKNLYGHAFCAGVDHGLTRVNKLVEAN